MEKHECKLCFKSFSNGRALGGHMRSHMKKLPLPSKPEASPPHTLLSFEAESASSSSSSEDDDDDDEDKGLSYGLRENPKKSIRLADPEFSFVMDTNNNGSVILQDRESETESSKDPTRSRRSKRAWKLGGFHDQYNHQFQHHHHNNKQILEQEAVKKEIKSKNKINKTESWTVEPEPASSISDATTEEDVAFCLMMLSRDKWKRHKDLERGYDVAAEDEDDEEEDDDDDDEEDEEEEEEAERSLADTDESEENFKSSKTRVRGRYTCETCKKVFRSYQALGGHRASHKKIKVAMEAELMEVDNNGGGGTSSSMAVVQDNTKKVHECPFCFRVFSSGQALGGHKRTHLTGSSATSIRASRKFVENLIDLNLPAPMEEDEVSQIENSGVSYAEFVNPIQR